MHHTTGIQPSFDIKTSCLAELERMRKINTLTCEVAVNKWFCSLKKHSRQWSLSWLGDNLTILLQLSVSGQSGLTNGNLSQLSPFSRFADRRKVWIFWILSSRVVCSTFASFFFVSLITGEKEVILYLLLETNDFILVWRLHVIRRFWKVAFWESHFVEFCWIWFKELSLVLLS